LALLYTAADGDPVGVVTVAMVTAGMVTVETMVRKTMVTKTMVGVDGRSRP
jgi:hypothetical protein